MCSLLYADDFNYAMINAKSLTTILGSDTRPLLVLLSGIVADLFASVGNVFMRHVLHFFLHCFICVYSDCMLQ